MPSGPKSSRVVQNRPALMIVLTIDPVRTGLFNQSSERSRTMSSYALAIRPYQTSVSAQVPSARGIVAALVAIVAVFASVLAVSLNSTTPEAAEFQVKWLDGRAAQVIDSETAGVDLVTLQRQDGVQALIKIAGPDSPTLYRFENAIPEGHIGVVQTDGSVIISDTVGYQQGVISAPWAYDQNGHSVPTHYTIEGTTLVQSVDHSQATAYPVIADPLIKAGWLSKLVATASLVLATAAIAGCAVGTGGACGAIAVGYAITLFGYYGSYGYW